MAKYFGVGGLRKGIVGKEKYYLKSNKNFIQEASKYIPVNSAWVKKEEFKDYVLSLLNEGVPQIYILDNLPQVINPYALLFVKNGDKRDVYVDENGQRTKIEISGEGGGGNDGVDVVNEIPANPQNNTIYFVNKAVTRNESVCDIYVYENDTLKKVNIDFTQVLNQAKTYTDTQCSNFEATCKAYTDTTCGTTLTTAKSYTDTTCATTLTSANTYTDTTCGTTLTSAKNYTDGKVAAFPHLYHHTICYNREGTGEVTFTFYNTQSTSMNLTDVFYALLDSGCDGNPSYYPCAGCTANGVCLVGVFASTFSSGGILSREFKALYFDGSNYNNVRYTYFNLGGHDTVKQIF